MNWRLLLLPVLFVMCGAVGTLAGVLASLTVEGAARYVVWAVVGLTVSVGGACLIERRCRR